MTFNGTPPVRQTLQMYNCAHELVFSCFACLQLNVHHNLLISKVTGFSSSQHFSLLWELICYMVSRKCYLPLNRDDIPTWFGVVVASFITLTKLLYVEPG